MKKKNLVIFILIATLLAGCGSSGTTSKSEKSKSKSGNKSEKTKVTSYTKVDQGMVFSAKELLNFVNSADECYRIYAIKDGSKFTVVCTSYLPLNTNDCFRNRKSVSEKYGVNEIFFTTSKIMTLKGNQELVVFSNRDTSMSRANIKPVKACERCCPILFHYSLNKDEYTMVGSYNSFLGSWKIDGDYKGQNVDVIEINGVPLSEQADCTICDERIYEESGESMRVFLTDKDKDICKVGYMDGTVYKECTLPTAYIVVSPSVEDGTDTSTATKEGYVILGNAEQLYDYASTDIDPRDNIISLDNNGLLKLEIN